MQNLHCQLAVLTLLVPVRLDRALEPNLKFIVGGFSSLINLRQQEVRHCRSVITLALMVMTSLRL